jgi:hypothetical protein
MFPRRALAAAALLSALALPGCATNVATGTWALDPQASGSGCPIPEMTLYRDSVSVMGFSSPARYRTAHGSTEIYQPDLGMALLRYRRDGQHLVVDMVGIPGIAAAMGGIGPCRYRRL